MLKSYFKIALRHLAKNKLYSSINIAGLSVGLACAMLIILYTKDELSFDRFHQGMHSMYLIAIDVRNPDGSSMDKMGYSSIFHGPTFKENLPEIYSFTRFNRTFKDIKLGEDVHSQLVLQADSNFFTFFTFPLLQGDPTRALQEPYSVVISQDMAIRHFGSEDALNKTILLVEEGKFIPYKVTGVAKRSPQNSSIQFDVVFPLHISLEETKNNNNWVSINVSTFVKLHQGSNPAAVASKMQVVFEKASKQAMERVREYGFTQSFYHLLQPFTAIHLSQEVENGFINTSTPLYSYILSTIAFFVLTLACINFVNLTIAKSTKRAREIGIRKVVGGARSQLIGQFLGESFVLCFFSFIAGLLLAFLLLPIFNNVVNKQLSFVYLIDGGLISLYIGLFIVTGLLAGFYPALILSAYNPIQTLYNRFRLSGKNYLQKSLIVFQFALATFLIIATVTVYLQFDYLTTKDLGYEPAHVVKVAKRNLSPAEAKLFGEELTKNPTILAVSPHRHGTMNGKIGVDSIRNFVYEVVNEQFIDLLHIQLKNGRNFSADFPSDSLNSVIINEAFVKMAGWNDPIGEQVEMYPFQGQKKQVIGVVKDYNFESLKKAVEPQAFSLALDSLELAYQQVLIRIQPGSEARSMPSIEQTFKKLFPVIPYSYEFYTEANLLSYETENRWKQMILLSSFLTIFISSIGLLGLSILTAESKFKEISIRKVLGASVQTIVFTLYKDLLTWIGLALLLAMPVAYYAAYKWLENYPYHISIGAGTFIGTALLVLIIAIATISYQTLKTARINPAQTLKSE